MSNTGSLDRWEAAWAAYDETTYQTALNYVSPTDVVLDIGAGDLRFARRAASVAKEVIAIERQPQLLSHATPLPDNLIVICADARQILWPQEVTLGTLLMRHCTHTKLYANRLLAQGCRRLVTNARWGLDVELVALNARLPWTSVQTGWFACLCGYTGFVPGSPDRLTEDQMRQVQEVGWCPACRRC